MSWKKRKFFLCVHFHVASVYSQLQLHQNETTHTILPSNSSSSSSPLNGEASCLSLCSLAKLHADQVRTERDCQSRQCLYEEANEILTFCKKCFPKPTAHSKKWMLTEAIIEHDRALFKLNMTSAKDAVESIFPLDPLEATYRQKSSQSDQKTKSMAEFHTNILLALCKLYSVSGNPIAAMPYLLDCLTLACSHYLDNTAALASICIAHLQLQLGLSAKALVLVKTSMAHLLAHASLYIQSCAKFLLVKCQLATSIASHSNTKRKQALLSSLTMLDSIAGSFRKLEANHKVCDVLYHKARIYEELGYTRERNNCASECCQINKEFGKTTNALALCCL